jgi:hypothetical protein
MGFSVLAQSGKKNAWVVEVGRVFLLMQRISFVAFVSGLFGVSHPGLLLGCDKVKDGLHKPLDNAPSEYTYIQERMYTSPFRRLRHCLWSCC